MPYADRAAKNAYQRKLRKRLRQDPAYRQKERVKQQVYEQARKQELRAYRASKGCAVCGERHPACLQFHHTDPTQKEFQIGTGQGIRRERLWKEIAKCVVLCANCHRKLHFSD